MKATPHLDEPRCEYMRLRAPREFVNERADWVNIHKKKRSARGEKRILAKISRNRAIAKSWMKRHYGPKDGKAKSGKKG